jgi:hypothetical protein
LLLVPAPYSFNFLSQGGSHAVDLGVDLIDCGSSGLVDVEKTVFFIDVSVEKRSDLLGDAYGTPSAIHVGEFPGDCAIF